MTAATAQDLYIVSRWLLTACVYAPDDDAAHDLFRAAGAVEGARVRIVDYEDMAAAVDRWADDGGPVR